MTREEKQKAIDALKISVPVMVVTQEEFKDYIQTLNKIMDLLEQEPNCSEIPTGSTTKNDSPKYCDRNVCLKNEYNNVGCEDCEVTKNQDSTTKNDLGVDCISRKAVLDAIDSKAWEFCDYLISKGRNDEQKPVSHFADNLRECVGEELPSVTPQEPKTGHWIANAPQYDMLNPQYICSECGNAHTRTTPYCEMCGAKMIEPQESEDKG